MTLLAPLGLLLGLTLAALVVFYILKVQPVDREVGSTYLWERLLPDLAAHQPWQRPRFPPLFFLQAAVLLGLALAVARPALLTLAEPASSVVLVLDASASMGAADEPPSRFARARDLARAAVDALPAGARATLVLAADRPVVAVGETADRLALLAALARATPTDAPGALDDALRLATALAQGAAGRAGPGRLEVFTDAAFDLPPELQELAVPVNWHRVGGEGRNRAITVLAARPDPGSQRRQQVYVRVERFGGDEPAALLSLLADGQIVESRPLAFDAAGVAEAVFEEVPDGARVVAARLAGADDLAADDLAALLLERPRATRVLLVTRGNVFLEKALALVPNVELDRVTPRRFGAVVPEDYDVVVFDADVPDLLPSRPLLVVGPAGSASLPVVGQLRRPAVTAWDRDHPVLRHVDLAEARFARAAQLEPPGWARAIVESGDAPLLLAGEEGGRRVVVLAFDLRQTNLPLLPAFPILVANALGYLEPPGFLSASAVAPGAEVTLSPALEARSVVVRDPSGQETTLPVEGRALTFADTAQVGLYRVAQRDGERTLAESAFAVNLLSAAESDLRPRPLPPGQPATAGEPRPVPLEGWRWLLGLGLATLVGEWWWYHRRYQ